MAALLVGSLGTGTLVAINNNGTLLYNVAAGFHFLNSVSGSGNLTFATISNANEVIQNGDLFRFHWNPHNSVRHPQARQHESSQRRLQRHPERRPDVFRYRVQSRPGLAIRNHHQRHRDHTRRRALTGGNNDGSVIRVGSATTTTLSGVITVASNALIGLDGGATLSLTNANNALVGSGTTLSLTGGGTRF